MMNSPQNRGDMHQYVCSKHLQEDLKSLLESGEESDIKFETSDNSVQLFAHSDVIAVRCYALRSNVLAFLREKQAGTRADTEVLEIRVRPVSRGALQHVLRYTYTGVIDLNDAYLYEFCVLSQQLGIPSLLQHVLRHLDDSEHSSIVLHILDQALNDTRPNRMLLGRLTNCLSDNCSRILKLADLRNVSLVTMQHLVKQESLGAAEVEIWEALVKWACYKSGMVQAQRVSLMASGDRRKVAEHLSPFCRPGHIRILNLDVHFFVSEVEPLGLFGHTELLIKYRFDAAVGKFPLTVAFPKDRYSFLARIRQRCMSFESERHPHPRGSCAKIKVQMPPWVSEMEVTFDERTALGRYSDLEFFMDEECTARLFSFRAYLTEATYDRSLCLIPSAVQSRVVSPPDPVIITGNQFWFTFYAPKNVGELAWGYKFTVSVLH